MRAGNFGTHWKKHKEDKTMATAILEKIDGDLVIVRERSSKVGVLGYRVPASQFAEGETVSYEIQRPKYDEPYARIEKNGQKYNAFLEIYATPAIYRKLNDD
jgi:hypothetical protein